MLVTAGVTKIFYFFSKIAYNLLCWDKRRYPDSGRTTIEVGRDV